MKLNAINLIAGADYEHQGLDPMLSTEKLSNSDYLSFPYIFCFFVVPIPGRLHFPQGLETLNLLFTSDLKGHYSQMQTTFHILTLLKLVAKTYLKL